MLKTKTSICLIFSITTIFTPLWSNAATMYSTHESFMGAGIFYGPGTIDDSTIFDVIIRNIAFSGPLSYVTPYVNNGKAEPNICSEHQLDEDPDGFLSDGITPVNENVDTCSMELNGMKIQMAIVNDGPHQGQQVATTTEDGVMVMTMDFALDLRIGKGGIVKLPFYGTTGEVTVPPSLQTRLGIEGGLDQAGSLKVGDKLKGRLGDYNNDGMLDGAIVVAGNMPLNSVFLPGAPYALIRYFETNIPYDGALYGKLPGYPANGNDNQPTVTIVEPGEQQ